jgi:Cu+-exporting ATPase
MAPTLDDEKNPELEDFTRRFCWTLSFTVIGVARAMGRHR